MLCRLAGVPSPRISLTKPLLAGPGLIVLLSLFSNPLLANDLPLSAQRLAFVAADKALLAGVPIAFEQLRSYPLYPYLLFRDLQQRLDTLPVGEVRAFLQDYADTPPADRLRAAWLKQLAEARRWADYLQDYQADDSLERACWQRQALLDSGQTQQALAGIAELWLRGASLPNACDPVLAHWRAQGGLTTDLIWQRFSLAMGKGEQRLASYLKGLLPQAEQMPADYWLQVHDNPRLVLEAYPHLDARDRRTPTILLHGLRRWSQQDSVTAAVALDTVKQRHRLPAQELTALERQVALFVASRGHPSALARLNALPAAVVDKEVREWRVRVQLQQANWPAVLDWLDGLQADESSSPQWRYWRARALEAVGRVDEAQAIYRLVAGQRDYHGFLAADRIAAPYRIQDVPLAITETDLAALEALPSLQRAHELFYLGRYWEARVEWRRATASFATAELQQAAKLAQRWGWHHQAIVTLARTDYWDDIALRFPLPYREPVKTHVQQANIDPAWVYAIMRQESLFRSDARSPAGALGLMQIMPATGEQIARELQITQPDRYGLLRPETNIRFGVYYLEKVLRRLQSNPLLATAAYNAGPNKVAEWLPVQSGIAADRWAETIPFRETRNYVKRVMEYAVIYGQRLRGNQPPLQTRMRLVLPAS